MNKMALIKCSYKESQISAFVVSNYQIESLFGKEQLIRKYYLAKR